jgi:hypothetical protein
VQGGQEEPISTSKKHHCGKRLRLTDWKSIKWLCCRGNPLLLLAISTKTTPGDSEAIGPCRYIIVFLQLGSCYLGSTVMIFLTVCQLFFPAFETAVLSARLASIATRRLTRALF